jgi:hypothetical protein
MATLFPARALELDNLCRFVGGQDLGDYGVNSQLVRDTASRGLVVSGQHEDVDVHGVQFTYGRRRGFAGCIR